MSRMSLLRRLLAVPLALYGAAAFAQTAAPASGAPQATVPAVQQPARQSAADRLLNDWPNLARYREANARAGLPAAGEKRVVFMGDSITDGWIRLSPEFFQNHPYLDRGISGQTTPQMLIRFRQDVIALKPKAVVILAGTNDIAGNTGPSTPEMIEDNLMSMVELARANDIKVILASILPAYDFPWRRGLEPAKKIAAMNDWIKAYAARTGVTYLDYYSSMVDDRGGLNPELSADGVHPNKAGYAIMEPLAEKAIAQALTEK
jgi:lysophospholipase L1-like esterase